MTLSSIKHEFENTTLDIDLIGKFVGLTDAWLVA